MKILKFTNTINAKNMLAALLSLALFFCVSVSQAMAEESCTMVCAGELNTQVDEETCEAVISYLDLIPSPCYESGYTVTIKTLNNQVIETGNPSVVVSLVGRYIYEVTHSDGDVTKACWGYMNFEDKKGPIKDLQGDVEPMTEVCGVLSLDPSGVDDLATEIVSCVVEEEYGKDALEPWFDALEISDYKDCTGVKDVFNYTEEIDLCDGVTEEVYDAIFDADIPEGWEATYAYKRSWFAADKTGRLSDTCAQFVIVVRPMASLITIDETIIAECGDENTAELAYPYFVDLDNNEDFFTCPTTADTEIRISPNAHYCKYSASVHYSDKISTCVEGDVSKVYKQISQWTVMDWCSGEIIYGNGGEEEFNKFQSTLEVYDSEEPIAISNPDVTSNTSLFDCVGSMVVGPFGFSDCVGIESVTTTAEYVVNGDDPHASFLEFVTVEGNGITLNEVPLGVQVNFTFKAIDYCGNEKTAYFNHTIIDDRAPVCISNDELYVSMIRTNHEGETTLGARVYGEDLDDSSRDNCYPLILEVRRADEAAVADDPESLWSEYVEFTDADLTEDGCKGAYKVELRVSEDRGDYAAASALSSTCWTNVIIEDNNAPIIEELEDKYTTCVEAHGDFDEPSIVGCHEGVDTRIDTLYDSECDYELMMHLRKVWKPYDTKHGAKVYSDSVSQNIYIANVHDTKFTFPIDTVMDCSMINIPEATAIEDIIDEKGCNNWLMEVEDRQFDSNDPDACLKILRKYTFINWCTWDPSNTELAVVTRPHDGVWSPEQQVMLHYRDADLDGINDIDDKYDGDLYDIEASEYGHLTDGAWVQVSDESQIQGQTVYNHVEDINRNYVTSVDAYQYGYFSYTQVIKVKDDEDPIAADPVVKQSCNPLEVDCELPTLVEITLGGSDNCSELFYDVWFQENQDGEFGNDPYGVLTGNVHSGYYPAGTHNFLISTSDACGNSVTDTLAITVEGECKKPTPVCYATFTAAMEDGTVDVWASDIESGSSSDNCSSYEELTFTLELLTDKNDDGLITSEDASTSAPETDVITLTCANIGTSYVALWATDAAGNEQFCIAPINVADNAEVCITETATVAGFVVNENDEAIDQVTVEVASSGMNSLAQIFDGFFDFINIPMHQDLTVTAAKDLGYLNGVSTSDLVLLQRHILGVQPLTSPYKLIAADANNDERVDTRDMLQISRLVLGIYDELPSNTSWRFVSSDYTFTNPISPWGFPESNNYTDLTGDVDNGFIGVKIGDISGNARPNRILGDDDQSALRTVSLATENVALVAGASTDIIISADQMKNITGYQFTIALADGVIFDGLELGEDSDLTEANFGLSKLDQNLITVSWATPETVSLENGKALFVLKLASAINTTVQEAVSLNSAFTPAEAYDNDLNGLDIMLNVISTDDQFELYQNIPNPVSNETIIGFNLPEAGRASLKIMDVSGKVLKAIEGSYSKGYNQIELDRADLGAAGVLYYQLDANQSSASKKMIIID